MSREIGEQKAVEAIESVIAQAIPYLEFLVDEIPPEATNTEIEAQLIDLGTLAVTMTPLQREDLFTRAHKRFPKLPKRPARKVFQDAVTKADLQRRANATAANNGAEAGVDAPAIDPTNIAEMRGAVHDQLGHYERAGDGERVSTFSLALVKVIVQETGQVWLACDVIGIGGRVLAKAWPINPKVWSSKRDFIRAFPSTEMQFTGSDDDVQGVHALLTMGGVDHVPHIRSTNALGFHMTPKGMRLVLAAGTIDESGEWMTEPDLIHLSDGITNLESRLSKEKLDFKGPEVRSIAKTFCEQIYKCHGHDAIVALVSWFMASCFKPRFQKRYGGFPIMNLIATHGSGKTSLLARVLWPALCGVMMGDPMSCTATLFALTRDFASTTSLALILDEFRKNDSSNRTVDTLIRMLRRLWAGETEARGHADQSLTIYRLLAAVLLAGEDGLDDPAMTERTNIVRLDKNWIGQNPQGAEAFHMLAALPLWKMGTAVQAWALSAGFDSIADEADEALRAILVKHGRANVADRVRVNLTAIVFGRLAFAAFAKSVGAELPATNIESVVVAQLREVLQEDQGEDGAELGQHVRDSFDNMLVDASIAANVGVIEAGVHYKVDGQTLWLWIPGCLRALAAWRRSTGDSIPWPSERALAHIAREKSERTSTYVVKVAERVNLADDRRVRCVGINLSKVPASLGVEDFAGPRNRGEGIGQASIDLWNQPLPKYGRRTEN